MAVLRASLCRSSSGTCTIAEHSGTTVCRGFLLTSHQQQGTCCLTKRLGAAGRGETTTGKAPLRAPASLPSSVTADTITDALPACPLYQGSTA